MLIVAAEVRVAEGAVEKVRDAIRSMETETLKEPGCHAYAFSIDISDATMVRIFERWESEDALRAHFATPHMANFGIAMAKAAPKSMDVKVYQVDKEIPLPTA